MAKPDWSVVDNAAPSTIFIEQDEYGICRESVIDRAIAAMPQRAQTALAADIERCAGMYHRMRDLPKLMRRPVEGLDSAEVIAWLEQAERAELARCIWTESDIRLFNIRVALEAERRAVAGKRSAA